MLLLTFASHEDLEPLKTKFARFAFNDAGHGKQFDVTNNHSLNYS